MSNRVRAALLADCGSGDAMNALYSAREKAAMLEPAFIAVGFSWDELVQLAEFMKYVEVPAGEHLFKEGDPGEYLGIIVEGTVSLVKRGPGDKMVPLEDITKHHLVGELALIDGEPRSASVVTKGVLKLLMLNRTSYEAILDTRPKLGAKFMRSLAKEVCSRLRKTTGILICH